MTSNTLASIIETLVIQSATGEEQEVHIVPIVDIVDKFAHSDITLWLSWSGGLLLSDALKKVAEIEKRNEDPESLVYEVEEGLTESEKAIIYGAFLMSSINEY